MFLLSDLPELVNDYTTGDVDWMIAYSVLLRLLGRHEVSEVMANLSPELVAKFESSLREEFPDPSQAHHGLWISNVGEPADRDQIIDSIIRWTVASRASCSE